MNQSGKRQKASDEGGCTGGLEWDNVPGSSKEVARKENGPVYEDALV